MSNPEIKDQFESIDSPSDWSELLNSLDELDSSEINELRDVLSNLENRQDIFNNLEWSFNNYFKDIDIPESWTDYNNNDALVLQTYAYLVMDDPSNIQLDSHFGPQTRDIYDLWEAKKDWKDIDEIIDRIKSHYNQSENPDNSIDWEQPAEWDESAEWGESSQWDLEMWSQWTQEGLEEWTWTEENETVQDSPSDIVNQINSEFDLPERGELSYDENEDKYEFNDHDSWETYTIFADDINNRQELLDWISENSGFEFEDDSSEDIESDEDLQEVLSDMSLSEAIDYIWSEKWPDSIPWKIFTTVSLFVERFGSVDSSEMSKEDMESYNDSYLDKVNTFISDDSENIWKSDIIDSLIELEAEWTEDWGDLESDELSWESIMTVLSDYQKSNDDISDSNWLLWPSTINELFWDVLDEWVESDLNDISVYQEIFDWDLSKALSDLDMETDDWVFGRETLSSLNDYLSSIVDENWNIKEWKEEEFNEFLETAISGSNSSAVEYFENIESQEFDNGFIETIWEFIRNKSEEEETKESDENKDEEK